MKINPATGELTLQSGLVLSSRLGRTQFLASREGTASTVFVRNEPWCSFRLGESEGNAAVAVFFKAEVFESVQFSVVDPKFGTGWDDWSQEKEMQRKVANDEWRITRGLTPGKKYTWGSVWSGFDPKGGFSSAVVRYEV